MFYKKCRKDRERKKTDKLNKQISKENENFKYNLAEVCSDKKTKNEYDQCVNSFVGKKQTTDEFINSIQLNENLKQKSKNIGAAPGMRKRTNKVVYENPMHQQAGKRKKKSRKESIAKENQKKKSRRK